jgi:hypothetical protein
LNNRPNPSTTGAKARSTNGFERASSRLTAPAVHGQPVGGGPLHPHHGQTDPGGHHQHATEHQRNGNENGIHGYSDLDVDDLAEPQHAHGHEQQTDTDGDEAEGLSKSGCR